MDINEFLSENSNDFFKKNGFRIIESYKNYLKIKSENIIMIFSHDDMENSNLVYVGKNEDSLFPMDDDVIFNVFGYYFNFSTATLSDFIDNMVLFFENEGSKLISDNKDSLQEIKKYINEKSKKYTLMLLDQQSLDKANKAWNQGDYKNFIKQLNKIKKEKWPSSYSLKYKIAWSKLN